MSLVGAVGREFVELLKDEVNLLADGKEVSKRLICFTALLLHRDHMVKKGCDIRCLLARHTNLWRTEEFDALLLEFERCTQHSILVKIREMKNSFIVSPMQFVFLQDLCFGVR